MTNELIRSGVSQFIPKILVMMVDVGNGGSNSFSFRKEFYVSML